MTSFLRRVPYLVAIALVAAAVGDPLVESISNTGVFGAAYHDGNQLSVGPTLLVAGALAFALAACRIVATWRGSRDGEGDWIVDVARRAGSVSPLRDLPVVFGAQLVTVFAMETVEQMVSGGTLQTGLAWLGAPIAFSLAIHALICIVLALTLARVCSGIMATVESLVRAALRFVLTVAEINGQCRFIAHRFPCHVRAQSPHVRQIGGRAPPLTLYFA